MDKLLYLSMTGATQTMLAQTAHANNLANVNTTGFKSDLAQARAMPVFGDGYNSRVYAMTERPATDQSAGMQNHTGSDLDLDYLCDSRGLLVLPGHEHDLLGNGVALCCSTLIAPE